MVSYLTDKRINLNISTLNPKQIQILKLENCLGFRAEYLGFYYNPQFVDHSMQRESAPATTEIKISALTVIKIVAIFFGLWLVYELRDIIATLVVALFLSAVINPAVDWF